MDVFYAKNLEEDSRHASISSTTKKLPRKSLFSYFSGHSEDPLDSDSKSPSAEKPHHPLSATGSVRSSKVSLGLT